MGGPVAHIAKKRGWTRREGKRFIYETGLLCNIVSAVCVFIAFCSPYWIISWPRVHSGFKRIGLWEVCFSGMVLQTDPSQKSYHGCWWILAPEFSEIKGWLMPWWFTLTQVLFTVVFVAEVCGTGLMAFLWVVTGMTQRKERPGAKTKRENIIMLQTGVIVTTVGMSVKTANMILFATAFYMDRNWLPLQHFNYLSWSYGLALVSCFVSIFATIAQLTYLKIFRQERREPPKDVSMGGYIPAPTGTSYGNKPSYGGGNSSRQDLSFGGASSGYPMKDMSYSTHSLRSQPQ